MSRWWRLAAGSLSVALIGAGYLRLEGAELGALDQRPRPTAAPAQQSAPPSLAALSPGASYRAVLDEYCVTCHSNTQHQLGRVPISLQTVDVENPGAHAAVWEKVIRKLRAGAMPPPGRPRPDEETYRTLVSYLETSIDRWAAANVNPGRTESLHRLTRAAYRNVIRDLLDLEIDVAPLLPADAADRQGFDNMAGELRVSPALVDRYLSAAHKISRLAVGLPPGGPAVETYSVPSFAQPLIAY